MPLVPAKAGTQPHEAWIPVCAGMSGGWSRVIEAASESAASALVLWQRQTDVQLAELLGRNLRRRAHHQVFRALIHREQHDLAQVLLAAKQHHDAIDTRRDAAVRRRAERERAQHAAELLLQHFFAVPGDGES